MATSPFSIAGSTIAPGTRATVKLPLPRLYTHAEMDIPVHVVHGRRSGPRLFVSAAVHGDELNGVEIVRRLLRLKALRTLRGTLIAVPVVNVFGFVSHSRYLPDRRDLNRSFPGSDKGSLASRMAKLFVDEILELATHGIDLHTGSNHRTNLPQVRACMDDQETRRLAHAFGAPVVLNSNVRDGSLRQAGFDRKLPMLLYEAGEALRFDDYSIRTGLRGIVRVMRMIGMLSQTAKGKRSSRRSLVAQSSYWVRAPISGVLHGSASLGSLVEKGQRLATIGDPLEDEQVAVRAPYGGIVIGLSRLPLAHQGDALFHVARIKGDPALDATVAAIQEQLGDDDFAPGA